MLDSYRQETTRLKEHFSDILTPKEVCIVGLEHYAYHVILRCSNSLSYMNEYHAINSGGHLRMNSLRLVIIALLNAS